MTVNTLTVLVDFSATAETSNLYFDDTTLGLFDARTFAAATEGVNIGAYVRSGSVTTGAQRVDGPLVRFDAGHATVVLDNRDRRFDPMNLSGPYVAAGVSQVTPMRKVQIITDGGLYLFTGYVDSWTLDYPATGNDATVTLSATDGTKVLAAFDGPEQASQGAGETTRTRLERIADHVRFPAENASTGFRTSSDGATLCQATTLASNAWTEMLLTADTEMGFLYFDPRGLLSLRSRHYVYTYEFGGVAGLFATFGDGGGSEIPYTAIDITYDDQQIFNDISIARTGGTAQSAENTVSQTQYLTHTYGRTDLVHQTDAESQLYADQVLAMCKDPAVTINSITLPLDVTLPVVFGSPVVGYTVKLTPPGGGSRISRRVIARGFDYSWSAGSGFITRIFFEDAERYAGFVFDSATNGILDTNWFLY